MENMKVAELVTNDGGWNIAHLEDWVPDEILIQLHVPPPPSERVGRDLCAWNDNADGQYSIASGYKLLCNLDDTPQTVNWKAIWKLGMKERVRHHIWIVCHDRLLTNERKSKLHLGAPDCPRCPGITENCLHVLRDCPIAHQVWMHLLKPTHRHNFFNCDLQNWITVNLTGDLNNTDFSWQSMWANARHSLWFWRNKLVHDSDFVMPWHPWETIIKDTKDYLMMQQKDIMQPSTNRTVTFIRWTPPDANWIKLNTDGSCLHECGLAGCGGLLRDSNGTWKGGFSKSLGYCSAYVAELWGIFKGLNLAHNKGFTHIIVELDAATIVTVLQKGTPGRSEGWGLISRIRKLLQEPGWTVQIQHVYKEANTCAHLLADIGNHQPEELLPYDVMPPTHIFYSSCISLLSIHKYD